MYLAAAGVGKIGLLDFDDVDLTNLQRQIMHGTSDVGRPKVESGADRLKQINPSIEIVTYNTILSSANAAGIIEPWDLVIDGTDNFPVRYLVNDTCQWLGKPLVYGSIYQWEGQNSVFLPGKGNACYRCLIPEPPPPGLVPSCAEGGVFGVLPGIVGSIQATEAIKLILGEGDVLDGRLLVFDAMGMEFREVKVRWDPACPVNGEEPTITEPIDYDMFCGVTPPAEVRAAEAVR
jgi:adenylyltransferase/sulfurtransferase